MGRGERLITDLLPRDRRAVFHSPDSREEMEGTSDAKSKEKKTAAELQDHGDDRYDRKGSVNGIENL